MLQSSTNKKKKQSSFVKKFYQQAEKSKFISYSVPPRSGEIKAHILTTLSIGTKVKVHKLQCSTNKCWDKNSNVTQLSLQAQKSKLISYSVSSTDRGINVSMLQYSVHRQKNQSSQLYQQAEKLEFIYHITLKVSRGVQNS